MPNFCLTREFNVPFIYNFSGMINQGFSDNGLWKQTTDRWFQIQINNHGKIMPNCQTLRPCHIYIVVVKYSFVCSLNPFWPIRMFTVIYCAYSYWPMPYAGVYIQGYYRTIIQPNYFPRSSAYYLTFEKLQLGLGINYYVFAMKLDII